MMRGKVVVNALEGMQVQAGGGRLTSSLSCGITDAFIPLAHSCHSSSQVVQVEAFMVLAAFACAGTLAERLHVATWILDRWVTRTRVGG